MRKHFAVCLALAAGGAGCVTPSAAFRKDALDRAAFDLKCTKDKLELTDLATNPATVGVTGCGNRITYVYSINGWVANTASSDAAPVDAKQ